jgi:hypothetical protein
MTLIPSILREIRLIIKKRACCNEVLISRKMDGIRIIYPTGVDKQLKMLNSIILHFLPEGLKYENKFLRAIFIKKCIFLQTSNTSFFACWMMHHHSRGNSLHATYARK